MQLEGISMKLEVVPCEIFQEVETLPFLLANEDLPESVMVQKSSDAIQDFLNVSAVEMMDARNPERLVLHPTSS